MRIPNLWSALLTTLIFLTACGGEADCDVSPQFRMNPNVLSAIPHTDGQIVTYEATDGTRFGVVFRDGFRPAVVELGCREMFIMTFESTAAAYSFSGEISASASGANLTSVFINYSVNQIGGNGLIVELFGAGEITAGRNLNARVLPELTRNGRTYRDVLEETYDNTLAGQVARVYYSTGEGLVGVELVGGGGFWQL